MHCRLSRMSCRLPSSKMLQRLHLLSLLFLVLLCSHTNATPATATRGNAGTSVGVPTGSTMEEDSSKMSDPAPKHDPPKHHDPPKETPTMHVVALDGTNYLTTATTNHTHQTPSIVHSLSQSFSIELWLRLDNTPAPHRTPIRRALVSSLVDVGTVQGGSEARGDPSRR